MLVVTGTSDILSYKAKSTSTSVRIIINYSKDGGEFTKLEEKSLANNMADFETYSITGLEAGNYKFQFMNDDYDLDDFEGFKLNADDPKFGIYTDAGCTTAAAASVTKDFGFVTTAAEAQVYYLKNDNTGTLTLTLGDVPTGFTAALGKASLAAGESTTLTIGMSVETKGYKNGNIIVSDEGSKMRPDVILHLDKQREVIIDSKVSLTAFMDYANAENEEDRDRFLKAHVDSINKHVKELSTKDYSSYIKAPKVKMDYVIMFVPHTGALWTALNAQPDLWRQAMDKNVFIADEQTLYGALKIVSTTWTQVAQAQNHEKVYELANEMIDRVGLFMEKYEAVCKALQKAAEEYDDGMKKLQPQGKSILNTSAKLIRLGAKNSGKHPVKALLDIDDIPPLPE
jgi:hypothetical protein